ncbi:alpha-L-fucosidase [Georgenia halophila]|uniref:alpha-L-fucosidase n=1 Tax=Georgenia halophila TaxID=620889 RepID=A0ABP8KXZ4_9MICO
MIDLDHLANVRPSHRQYEWQKLELYGFVHFGMNTMTGRQWGTGEEDADLFDPVDLDADQWAATLRSAGIRGLILTAKHHDGFCLWPSRHSEHTVAASPWRDGRGDVVGEVADACARHGLRFGLYLSPWDRAEPTYGSGTAYDDVYVGQLVELLTGYGDIFTVWLDGANGEGPNGKRQVYDWERYYRTIRALQPDAVISVCGPDVRWCGNEAGQTRPDEWSVVPHALQDVERIAERSQQVDDGAFSRTVRSDDRDLGSRTALAALPARAGDLVWYPAEVNTSIRPGWFHHPDEQPRAAEELFDIYQHSVGGNATLLLNVPPTRTGRIADGDREALAGLGRLVDGLRASALTRIDHVTFSSRPAPRAVLTTLDNDVGHWRPADGDTRPWVELTFGRQTLDGVVLKEQITVGQRIEEVRILIGDGDAWHHVATTGTVGYQRIVRFHPVAAERLRVEVVRSRLAPTLAAVVPLAASPDKG